MIASDESNEMKGGETVPNKSEVIMPFYENIDGLPNDNIGYYKGMEACY